jgi:hypothetical protein
MGEEKMTERIDKSSHVQRNPRVAYRALGDEGGLLLHLDTSAYHRVNSMGGLIWAELGDEGAIFEDLVRRLEDRVEDSPAGLAAEASQFLTELRQRDLVVLA